jgi:alpha-ketoglutarate-dependent taurine dioxygenase
MSEVLQDNIRFSEMPLDGDQCLPLVVEPAADELVLADWAMRNRRLIDSWLDRHGAVLFRGFREASVSEFEQIVTAVAGELMQYRERSSPRRQVAGNVYTSTEHPPDQNIILHNEHSYSIKFPMRIFFYCMVPASKGGETPLADTRKILDRIDPKIRHRFMEKRWMYVRNLGGGIGLPWQEVFQTEDKAVVEAYCRMARMEFEWRDGDRLRTRQVRPAIARHPRTGAMVWFNHATFFHVSSLDPALRDAMLTVFEEEDLPNNTYYGDGSPIEASVLDELRGAYEQETAIFPWEQGDILLLDNMMTAHGRKSFEGPRTVLVAMADVYSREDIEFGTDQ